MEMKICPECEQSFAPDRSWQRFCSNKHRIQYHNREKLGGIHIARPLLAELESLAEAQQTSVTEMANRILHNALNPGSRPLTDAEIYFGGKENIRKPEELKQNGH